MPDACHHGHPFGPGTVQVGTQACGGHTGQHRSYYCVECGDITYTPPVGSACRLLHGAAGVRNL